jgi:hypothetical protein
MDAFEKRQGRTDCTNDITKTKSKEHFATTSPRGYDVSFALKVER